MTRPESERPGHQLLCSSHTSQVSRILHCPQRPQLPVALVHGWFRIFNDSRHDSRLLDCSVIWRRMDTSQSQYPTVGDKASFRKESQTSLCFARRYRDSCTSASVGSQRREGAVDRDQCASKLTSSHFLMHAYVQAACVSSCVLEFLATSRLAALPPRSQLPERYRISKGRLYFR